MGFRRKDKQVRFMRRHFRRSIYYVYCVLEVRAQVQSSAVVSKESEASQNYAQTLSNKYFLYCVLEVKAQVPSSAMASKER